MPDPITARLAAITDDHDGSPALPDPEALAAMVGAWGAVDRQQMAALLLTRLSDLQMEARRRGDLASALKALDAMARVAKV
jgi:hypothetical protein